MALRRQKVMITALFINFIVMLYLAIQQHRYISNGEGCLTETKSFELHKKKIWGTPQDIWGTPQDIAETITFILRDFEMFDNAILETVKELQQLLNKTNVLVIGDTIPYPPLVLKEKVNVKFVSLQSNLLHNYSSSRPDHLIKTKFVLVIPDAAKFKHWKHLQTAISMLSDNSRTQAVVMGVGREMLRCMSFEVDLKRWQISIAMPNSSFGGCEIFMGDQALLMRSETFRSLAEPFARPFPFTFYIQAKLRQWKIRYIKQFNLGWLKVLYLDPHNKWKHKHLDDERLASFYKRVGIKAVVQPNGKLDYYGCTKTTPRCFGTIVEDMPEYLYENKWTPPCCLNALRITAKHVFHILEQENVRYWLEGGSLLGAARIGDIIPWDYDVDIGIYREDIDKSSYLKDAKQGNFIDEEGFVWEKATEGDFFRVQFSEQNHLHVDIHPFYPKNGTMTKDTWFKTHRQDTEFPEHYLIPLTKITFAGTVASAPNNVRQFLEMKFGAGVIEQPRFPNLKSVE